MQFIKRLFGVILLPLALATPIQAEKTVNDSTDYTFMGNYLQIGTKSYYQNSQKMRSIEDNLAIIAYSDYCYGASKHRLITLRYSTASYQVTTRGSFLPTTTEERVYSFLMGFKYRFRPEKKFKPFLEVGLGISDPAPTHYGDVKFATSFAFGFQYQLNSKWALRLESRGIAWRQTEGYNNQTISTSEISIGLGYMSKVRRLGKIIDSLLPF